MKTILLPFLLPAAFVLLGCSEECLRHSDCPSALVCNAGACVMPPSDAGMDGADATAEDAGGSDGSVADAGGPDAATDVDAAMESDAGPTTDAGMETDAAMDIDAGMETDAAMDVDASTPDTDGGTADAGP